MFLNSKGVPYKKCCIISNLNLNCNKRDWFKCSIHWIYCSPYPIKNALLPEAFHKKSFHNVALPTCRELICRMLMKSLQWKLLSFLFFLMLFYNWYGIKLSNESRKTWRKCNFNLRIFCGNNKNCVMKFLSRKFSKKMQ